MRDPEVTWKETRRFLRKDPRWDTLDSLSKPEKEKYFTEHIDELNKKRRKQFIKMLEENGVSPAASYHSLSCPYSLYS